jgi:hypothetical protein
MKTVPTKPAVLRTMMGMNHLDLSVQCLGSIVKFCRHPLEIVIHEDGTLDQPARDRLVAELGNVRFQDRAESSLMVDEMLKAHPRCRAFRHKHIMAMQVLDIPLLTPEGERVIYSDSDILYTRPVECVPFFVGGSYAFTGTRDIKESYSVHLKQWPLLRTLGVRLASRICAGMMSFDRSAHDLDYIEWLFKLDEEHGLFSGYPFFMPQTIVAALAARAGAGCVDPSECIVAHRSNFEQAKRASVIHFAGYSRNFFSDIYRAINPAAAGWAPRRLAVVPTPDCGIGRRLISMARSRLFLGEDGAGTRNQPESSSEGAAEANPGSAAPKQPAGAGRLLIVTPTLGKAESLSETMTGIEMLGLDFIHVFACPKAAMEDLRSRYPKSIVVEDAGREGGIYGALNAALHAVPDGWEWFTYINDDDLLTTGFARMVRTHLSRPVPEPVTYGKVRLIDEKSHPVNYVTTEPTPRFIPAILQQGMSPLNQQGMLFHRSVVEKLGGFDIRYKLCADLDFWVRAYAAGFSFRYYPIEVGRFRVRAGQLSGDVQLTRREQAEIVRRHFPPTRSRLALACIRFRYRLLNAPKYLTRIVTAGWKTSDQLLGGSRAP